MKFLRCCVLSVAVFSVVLLSQPRVRAQSLEATEDVSEVQIQLQEEVGESTREAEFSGEVPEGFVEETIALTNQERVKAGLKALLTNALLNKSAQGHATDMATKNYFSHTSLNGQSPFQRMRAAGYFGTYMGENIAAGYRTPTDVVRGWMNSTGHRKNILNPNYQEIGVGYAYNLRSTYKSYWVQNFGRR